MQKSELEILKTSSLFRGMSDADINWLLSDERSVIRHFPKGAFIFKELDRPGQVYVLLDGKVVIAKGTLSGKRILITRIEQSGEMFGEVYAFLGKDRLFSGRTAG